MNYNFDNIQTTETLLMRKYSRSALTIEEAAEELDVEAADIEQMISEERLHVISVGNKTRIPLSSLSLLIGGQPIGTTGQIFTGEKHLVNDLLEEVLQKKKKNCRKLSSYDWYCYQAKHIRDYFEGVYLEDLDAKQLDQFFHHIVRDKNGKQMSQRFLQAIACLLKNVVSAGKSYLKDNPFDDLDRLPTGKKTNSRRRTLSKQTVWRLTYALESSVIFRPMIILMLLSGLRIGEVLALRWSDLDRDNDVIHVEQGLSIEYDEDDDGKLINRRYEIGDTKTISSVRDVPVDPYVFQVLDDWHGFVRSQPDLMKKIREQGNEDIIFINKYGRLRNYQTLRRNFQSLLKKNGLDDVPITFHRFRHTYATLLQEAGVDSNIIRELLGHADITTTTNYYINVDMEPMKRASCLLSDKIREIIRT